MKESAASDAAAKQDVLLPPEGAVDTHEDEAENNKPLQNNLTEQKEMKAMSTHEDRAQPEGKGLGESDLFFPPITCSTCSTHNILKTQFSLYISIHIFYIYHTYLIYI